MLRRPTHHPTPALHSPARFPVPSTAVSVVTGGSAATAGGHAGLPLQAPSLPDMLLGASSASPGAGGSASVFFMALLVLGLVIAWLVRRLGTAVDLRWSPVPTPVLDRPG
jgi:MYXO-CTERM domain-containing protein